MLPSILHRTHSFHTSALAATLISPSRRGRPAEKPVYKLNDDPNSALIRVGEKSGGYLRSMTEALALLRAVERQFGTVREFKFIRVIFKDPASLNLITIEPQHYSFIRPSVVLDRPGGVGLDEIEPFLQSQQLEIKTIPKQALPSFEDIERQEVNAVEEEMENVVYQPFGRAAVESSNSTAASFLRWGGFHKIKPIRTDTSLDIKNAFRPTEIDQYRMRSALRQYSKQLRTHNPYEVTPGKESEWKEWEPLPGFGPTSEPEAAPPDEWEPLPGHGSVPQDTPMPSQLSQTPSPPLSSKAAPTGPTSTTPSTSKPQTSPTPSQTSPEVPSPVDPVAAAQAIALKMDSQAKSIERRKAKQDKYRRELKEGGSIPDIVKKHKEKPSMKALRAQVLKERLAKNVERQQAETPKTIKERVSGFFSGLF
ncbi:hypothetical protein H0H87_008241 [Tephrocybe sp. NHM501043]|nr:hypothetical protein H0H87_008241 [Tephrocybe sp. NHM501043]